MSHKIKVTNDGYVWCIVTYAAPVLFSSGAMSIYELHDDDTESRIETHEDLQRALESGNPIGIDVGYLYKHSDIQAYLKSKGYHVEALWHVSDATERYGCNEEEAYELLDRAINRTIPEVFEELDYYAQNLMNFKIK
jgi:hypothetical protein